MKIRIVVGRFLTVSKFEFTIIPRKHQLIWLDLKIDQRNLLYFITFDKII